MVEPRTLAAAVVVIQPGSGPSEPYIGWGSVAIIVPRSARAVADDGLALGDAEVERGRAAGVGECAALAGGRVPRDGPGDGRADRIAATGLVGGDVLVDVGAVGGLAVAAVGVPWRAGTVAGDGVAVAHGPRHGRRFGGDRDRDAGERGAGVEGLEGGAGDPGRGRASTGPAGTRTGRRRRPGCRRGRRTRGSRWCRPPWHRRWTADPAPAAPGRAAEPVPLAPHTAAAAVPWALRCWARMPPVRCC